MRDKRKERKRNVFLVNEIQDSFDMKEKIKSRHQNKTEPNFSDTIANSTSFEEASGG